MKQKRRIIRRLLPGSLVLFLATGLASTATAQPVKTLRYEGVLMESGQPLSGASIDLRFVICATEACTAELWSETHTGISVTDGLVARTLGQNALFPADLFDGDELYLGIDVGSTPLRPRMQIHHVPFAARAGSVDVANVRGIDLGSCAIGNHLEVTDATPGSVILNCLDPNTGASSSSVTSPIAAQGILETSSVRCNLSGRRFVSGGCGCYTQAFPNNDTPAVDCLIHEGRPIFEGGLVVGWTCSGSITGTNTRYLSARAICTSN